MMQRALRLASSLPVRIVVTAGLLVALAVSIDWGTVGDRLSGGRWGWFAAAVGVLFVALIVAALRWHAFLRTAEVEASVGVAVRAFLIGTFANNLLPQLGGDAVRALVVAPPGSGSPVRAIVSALVDRVSALGCLVLLAWGCVVVAAGDVPSTLVLGLLAITALGAAGTLVLGVLLRRGVGVIRAILPDRLRPSTREVRATLTAYARDRRLLSIGLALGVAYQVLVVLETWMLARAIDLDVSYEVLAVAIPVVLVVTLIPISLGGFGLREGGFVVMLADAGVEAADATLLSLLSVVALALASLPGAVAMVTPKSRQDRYPPRLPAFQPDDEHI
jgi:uncharacterized protein (TIRG00374 family)